MEPESSSIPGALPIQTLTCVSTPFTGNFDISRGIIPLALEVQTIEQQPVTRVDIHFMDHPQRNYAIVAGEGKYYGLAFFEYCLQKYGTAEEQAGGVIPITIPMVFEAIMYYGRPLWNDIAQKHPAIIPFRRVLAGEEVCISLFYAFND